MSHVKNAQVHYIVSPRSEHPCVEAADQQLIFFVLEKYPSFIIFRGTVCGKDSIQCFLFFKLDELGFLNSLISHLYLNFN